MELLCVARMWKYGDDEGDEEEGEDDGEEEEEEEDGDEEEDDGDDPLCVYVSGGHNKFTSCVYVENTPAASAAAAVAAAVAALCKQYCSVNHLRASK